MTIETSVTRPLAELGPDTALAVLLFDDDPSLEHEPFDHTLRRRVESLPTEAITHMSLYETRALFSEGKGPTLLLTGAGKWNDLDLLGLKRVVAAASRAATRVGFRHLALCDPQRHPLAETAQAAAEGAGYGSYSPALRKTRGEARAELLSLSLATPRVADAEVQAGFRRGTIVADSTRTARDLVNLPPNELTPVSLAQRARELSIDLDIDVEVIDERGLADQGMGSFLAVATGSHEPPRLIVMRYRAGGGGPRLAVVGKDMTFDSGGLSLKPAQQMETMKGDMGGAAAVIAGILGIARLGLPGISVTGYVGAAENMPGGGAMRPGDVVRALNGKTIEVLNTDAEGRLVLADLLTYADQEGATHIIDFATLTAGARVALGSAASLLAGRPISWVDEVAASAAAGLERVWPMPLYPEYRTAMKSDVADIKNTGGRGASPLTAAPFLGDFVGSTPWAHVDIAGTSFNDVDLPYAPEGGTGSEAGTIVNLAQRLSRQTNEELEREKGNPVER